MDKKTALITGSVAAIAATIIFFSARDYQPDAATKNGVPVAACSRPDVEARFTNNNTLTDYQFQKPNDRRAIEKGHLIDNSQFVVLHEGCNEIIEKWSFISKVPFEKDQSLGFWFGKIATLLKTAPLDSSHSDFALLKDSLERASKSLEMDLTKALPLDGSSGQISLKAIKLLDDNTLLDLEYIRKN